MRLRRSNAPSSPGFLQASASARICRFSLAENRRRFAVATTSGSGARPAAGAAPSLALRAPCGAAPAAELICMSIKEEPIPLSVMSAPAGTLNGPRQVSQLRLARGGGLAVYARVVMAVKPNEDLAAAAKHLEADDEPILAGSKVSADACERRPPYSFR